MAADDEPAGPGGQAERFLADWQRRCLPLPLCSAPSELVYAAYTLWCQLQSVPKPAPPNSFGTSVRRAGFHKARHLIRMPGAVNCSQHAVLHPPGKQLKSGAPLDRSAAAFGASLNGWRAAVGNLAERSLAATSEGQG
jgi:hypothetical protein